MVCYSIQLGLLDMTTYMYLECHPVTDPWLVVGDAMGCALHTLMTKGGGAFVSEFTKI